MSWWQILLSYFVPLISVGLSYVLGRREARKSYISSVQKERYNTFYAPFIQKLYAGMMWDIGFSSLSTAAKGVYFDLIMHNIQFIDEKTVMLIPDFYHAMLDNFEQENGAMHQVNESVELDEIFRQIAISILSQAKILSKKLHLPDIGAYAATKFAESAQNSK